MITNDPRQALIDAAERKLAALDREIESKVRDRDDLDKHIQWLREFAFDEGAADGGKSPRRRRAVTGRKAADGQSPIEMIRSQATAYVINCIRPIPTSVLFQAMENAGIRILGQNPAGNLGSKLNQIPGKPLINLPKFGWWPRDRPYPPAGYDPAKESTVEA
ncbi:MAG TPA: hypothetical protein VGG99_17590 [Acetobacteraceae bacterium]|jgi:hypothetical protein